MYNVCMFIMHKFYMNNELKNYTEEVKRAVVPTNDFVFKRIFGKEGNEEMGHGDGSLVPTFEKKGTVLISQVWIKSFDFKALL